MIQVKERNDAESAKSEQKEGSGQGMGELELLSGQDKTSGE